MSGQTNSQNNPSFFIMDNKIPEAFSKVMNEILIDKVKKYDYVLLYHGTDFWTVQKALREGVKAKHGKYTYYTDKPEIARKYAIKRAIQRGVPVGVIMVVKVPEDTLEITKPHEFRTVAPGEFFAWYQSIVIKDNPRIWRWLHE